MADSGRIQWIYYLVWIGIFGNIAVLDNVVSAENLAVLSCPAGWDLRGSQCYKLYNKRLSWWSAVDACRLQGATIVQVRDLPTNNYLGSKSTNASFTDFWIGLKKAANFSGKFINAEWSDGTQWSLYTGFWSNGQPNFSLGDCVYIAGDRGHYLWSLGSCEEKKAVICEFKACDIDSFRCMNSVCISNSRVCDGQEDCQDGSDEISCSSLCHNYYEKESGVISVGNPGFYSANTSCKWTIEGPVGSVIEIDFTNVSTEAGVDEIVILGSGKSDSYSVTLGRLSGTVSNSTFRSGNNFMIVRFTSDGVTQMRGFSANWTAVQSQYSDNGEMLTSDTSFKNLSSFRYPNPYLPNQESIYIISTQQSRQIIVIEILDLDLAEGDYINIRNGVDAKSSLVAQLNSTTSKSKRHIFSTTSLMYLFFKTSQTVKKSNKGFSFRYKTGCSITLEEDSGEIMSPGYPYINYTDFQNCTWQIKTKLPKSITLKFNDFYIHPSDFLQIYAGLDSQSQAVHPGKGFSLTKPADITVLDGSLFLQFQTSAILNDRGFYAVYSINCPNPVFNPNTTAVPSSSNYTLGTSLNVSCNSGFVFDSEEFYENATSGRQSKTLVTMVCGLGGVWNVQRTPKCIAKLCGAAPLINYGFVQTSTGVDFGSKITYACFNGYILSGNGSGSCLSTGSWSTLPTCNALSNCPQLKIQSTNITGSLVLNNGTAIGSIYNFTCQQGYKLTGSPTLICQQNGTWSGQLPTCQRRLCPLPTISQATLKTNATTVYLGDSVTLECNSGYRINGSNSSSMILTCYSDLSFGTLPTCQAYNFCLDAQCGVDQICSPTSGGYECLCKSGYTKQENKCQDIDECQGGTGNCSQICNNLPGSYSCSCLSGYSLYTYNGLNNYTVPNGETGLRVGDVYYINHTCVLNVCPDVTFIANGYIKNPRTTYHVNDTVSIGCHLGFISNVSSATCSVSGTWEPRVPMCTVAQCPPDKPSVLSNPPDQVTPSSDVDYGSNVTITCKYQGLVTGIRTRTCVYDPSVLSYRLQGEGYECEAPPTDCGPPDEYLPAGGVALFLQGNSTLVGGYFRFECTFPYFLKGEPLGTNVTCQKNGLWGFGKLDCIYGVCPDPGSPPDGHASLTGYQYKNTTSYSCSRPGFEPIPNTTLLCEQSEDGSSLEWSSGPPACNDTAKPTFKNCPTSPILVKRYAAAHFEIPTAEDNSGMVVEFIVDPPYFQPNQSISKNLTVTYTAKDHAGLTSTCTVVIQIQDDIPPVVQCPDPVVLNSSITFAFTNNLVNASDNVGVVETKFSPVNITVTSLDKGHAFNVTAFVFDSNGNNASCQFHVYVTDLCNSTFNSTSGVLPCSECRGNTFRVNSTYCQPCPDNTLALPPGSTSNFNCSGTDCYCARACPKGYYSASGYGPDCHLCPAGYTSSSGSAECRECLSNQTSTPEVGDCVDAASLFCGLDSNPCLNNGSCHVANHNYFCNCLPGYTGRNCQDTINACMSTPCYYGATCTTGSSGSYTCTCPIGTRGADCEENINDCTLDSCSGHGTCIDSLGSFSCLCIDGFNGTRCENRQVLACARIQCDHQGTLFCEPRNGSEVYARCVCRAGYGGQNCSQIIDLCASEPCKNGGQCNQSNGQIFCTCISGFTGSRCENLSDTCGQTVLCGQYSCENDYRTGLPMCICPPEYTQSPVCYFNYSHGHSLRGLLIETLNSSLRGCSIICRDEPSCVGFSFVSTSDQLSNLSVTGNCSLFSKVEQKVTESTQFILSAEKICEDVEDETFFSQWITPMGYKNGFDVRLQTVITEFVEVFCGTTEPLKAECRSKQPGQLLSPSVSCGFDKATCPADRGVNCSDVEIRFVCARSRANSKCSLRNACTELDPCAQGQCVVNSTGPPYYRCQCGQGYEGSQCQHEVNDCQLPSGGLACLNGATCVDQQNGSTCNCAPGYTGTHCETDVNECLHSDCDNNGTEKCVDGVNKFTCKCRPGFTGQSCEIDVNECLSEPCFHEGGCTNLVGGYLCQCARGWTGQQCETMTDQCNNNNQTRCEGGAACLNLVNDFYCNCSTQTYGKTCGQVPDACTTANPCRNGGQCVSNGQHCNCVPGTTGGNCQLQEFLSCQNGGTLVVTNTTSPPTCVCTDEYTGTQCDALVNSCDQTTCHTTARCIDGLSQSFCRCPVGKKGAQCTEDINDDFDVCIKPSLDNSGATLLYPAPYNATGGFTVKLWVRYTTPGATGMFLALYYALNGYTSDTLEPVLYLDDGGAQLGNSSHLPYSGQQINDGNWHYIIVSWRKGDSRLDLVVDFNNTSATSGLQGAVLVGGGFLPVVGAPKSGGGKSFYGCVSRLDVLCHALNMSTELPLLRSNPSTYPGDVFRWGELQVYGNVLVMRPSSASLAQCNGVSTTCLAPRDMSPPGILSCPANLAVPSVYQDQAVSWTLPVFNGTVNISSTDTPGSNFTRGKHTVVYVAKYDSGNAALCDFSLYINTAFCPNLTRPRGNGAEDCSTVNNFSSCSIGCPVNFTIVTDRPVYFTCGPDGDWESLTDNLYPACGRINEDARVDVSLTIQYKRNETNCNETAVRNRTLQDLSLLSQQWGSLLCSTADCSDVSIQVNCSLPFNIFVNIGLKNVTSKLSNGTNTMATNDVFLVAILDNDGFSIPSILPSAVLSKEDFAVSVNYVCPTGQVVRSGQCVSCGPGTFYNSSVAECENCPKGQFSETYGLSSCLSCPAGQTTPGKGSDSSSLCTSICPAGQQFNESTNVCTDCPVGFYRNGSLNGQCQECPSNYTTSGRGSTSRDNCSLVNCTAINSCLPCQQGYYRNTSILTETVCVLCPVDFITAKNSSGLSETDCSIRNCTKPGEYRNPTSNQCEVCPVGTYNSEKWQDGCKTCPAGNTTKSTGSTSLDQCYSNCRSGQQVNESTNVCTDCPIGFFRNVSLGWQCQECPSNYTTSGRGSTSRDNCSLVNCTAINSCLPCQQGYYRNTSILTETVCVLCPVDFITAKNSSGLSETDCSIRNCTKPGEYRNPKSNQCEVCPVGTYNSEKWQDGCKTCPAGDTTRSTGSTSQDQCYRVCPSGQQVNESTNVCTDCPTGSYRDSSASWLCQPCPAGYTSATGSTSSGSCFLANCGSGFEYREQTKSCIPCPVGYYRNATSQLSCVSCPVDFITLGLGSSSLSNCSTRNCTTPGEYRSPTSNQCEVCPVGTYSSEKWQDGCKTCSAGLTTRSTGSNSQDQCYEPWIPEDKAKIIIGCVVGIGCFLLLLILLLVFLIRRHKLTKGRQRKSEDSPDSSSRLGASSVNSTRFSTLIKRADLRGTPRPDQDYALDPAFYKSKPASEAGMEANVNQSFYTWKNSFKF